MKPFYFGTSSKRLFGIYHAPEAGDREAGVVVCHSFGREYILGHRTLRQLAIQLTRAGFHVLRFDYHGCGDSSGENHEGDLGQWTEDISTAIDEIRDYGGLQEVSLIGLRLGASLSALVGEERSDLRSTVFWEPIVNGGRYVEELLRSHRDWLRDQPSNGTVSESPESLGFPLAESMRADLEKLDLLSIRRAPARALVVDQTENTASRRFVDALRKLESDVDYRKIAAPRVWVKGEMNKALVPVPVLRSIVSWMSEVYA